MDKNILRSRIILAVGLALCLSVGRYAIEGAVEEKLPTLRSLILEDSYHFVYQLEVSGIEEVMTVEEWADDKTLRLDLISGANRTSYLTYGKTGELFMYQPFVCERLTDKPKQLEKLSQLFLGFPIEDESRIGQEPVMAYGLGPLWSMASISATKVKKNKATTSSVLEHDFLDYYFVTLGKNKLPDQLDFSLSFYFTRGKNSFLESVDWNIQGNKGPIARAKMLHVDRRPIDKSVFRLPIAHGCKRSAKFDETLNLSIGKMLLHRGPPSQVNLEITTNIQKDKVIGSWSTRSYSMNVMRADRSTGGSGEQSFYVSQIQERDERTGRLSKEKQIWVQNESSEEALVYSTDQSSGSCKIGRKSPKDLVELKFPIYNDDGETSEDSRLVLSLGAEALSSLLYSQTEYHLIDEGETVISGSQKQLFRNRMYEMRVKDYEFRRGSGKTRETIQYPVSIVKQISSNSRYLERIDRGQMEFIGNEQLNLAEDYRLITSIFVYSSNYSRILYKVTIDVVGNHEVDFVYALKQLDVSQCYPIEESQDITIKYPIESISLMKSVLKFERSVKSQLYSNLVMLAQSFLSPLQVSNLQLSVDAFYLRVQMTLIQIPVSHMFQLERGKSLDEAEGEQSLSRSHSASAEKCSEHCEQHNCLVFAFDPETHICIVELRPFTAKQIEQPSSELYSYIGRDSKKSPTSGRPSFATESIIEIFTQAISDGELDTDKQEKDTNLLELVVKNGKKEVRLKPITIEHGLESMNEFVRELTSEQTNSSSGATSITLLNSNSKFKLEYNLIFDNQVLDDESGPKFGYATYEECEEKCSQTDCRSFSYCKLTSSCVLSNLHSSRELQPHSYKAELSAGCQIYSLNYFRKFESFGAAYMPTQSGKQFVVVEEVSSAQDCSIACMEAPKFSCQGFYYCQNSKRCYITSDHPLYWDSQIRPKFVNPKVSEGGKTSKEEVCEYFSRSYLAQFDKYLGKRIELTPKQMETTPTILSNEANSNDFARDCIERGCLAFHVCSPETKTSMQSSLLVYDQITREQVNKDSRCTTFVLSDKSSFNTGRLKLIEGDKNRAEVMGKPDSEADPGTQTGSTGGQNVDDDIFGPAIKLISKPIEESSEAQSADEGSHWLAKSVSFLSGIIIGSVVVMIWNQAYANGYYGRLRSFFGK